MSRGFVCSRSNWDEVTCGFFRRRETRYLSARENGNSSEKNENLDDGIHNFEHRLVSTKSLGKCGCYRKFRTTRTLKTAIQSLQPCPLAELEFLKKRNGKLAAAFAHMVNGAEEVGYD